jgi:hypothetical protein
MSCIVSLRNKLAETHFFWPRFVKECYVWQGLSCRNSTAATTKIMAISLSWGSSDRLYICQLRMWWPTCFMVPVNCHICRIPTHLSSRLSIQTRLPLSGSSWLRVLDVVMDHQKKYPRQTNAKNCKRKDNMGDFSFLPVPKILQQLVNLLGSV